MSDREIIQGFLNGSKREYSQITGWITSMVRSRLWEDRVAPEDVVADTTMKLLINLRDESFRLESSLKTYVQRITLYTLVDAGRRVKKFDPLIDNASLSDPANPHSILVEMEEKELLRRAMAMLPDGCRTLMAMALVERVKCREIARRLGSSEGAVKTRLSRCRNKVTELIKGII